MPDIPSVEPNLENQKVKEALDRLHKATTPMVTDILSFAQRGVTETLAALQRAQTSVPDIADAAVNLGAAHADLLTSTIERKRQRP